MLLYTFVQTQLVTFPRVLGSRSKLSYMRHRGIKDETAPQREAELKYREYGGFKRGLHIIAIATAGANKGSAYICSSHFRSPLTLQNSTLKPVFYVNQL